MEDAIEDEPSKVQDKIYETIGYLRQHGFHLSTQYLRRLSGTKRLWELRIKYQKQYRIFLARAGEQEIVLLHMIIKKTQKTPAQELYTAEERLRQYE